MGRFDTCFTASPRVALVPARNMATIRKVAGCLLGLAAVTLPVHGAIVPGSLPGSLTVDASGAALYSLPIEVPPAAGGLQPSLSFEYSSRRNNGLMGVGWSVEGMSTIHRCPRIRADYGHVRGIHLDASDDYCLDGQRLIAVSGANGADGTEYRTQVESFSRIVSYGSVSGTGPASWRVWTRDGRVLDFGSTTDSQVRAQGKAAIRTYALNRIQDLSGNELTVAYITSSSTGEHRLDRIDYSANPSAGVAPQASVTFVYEPRPDIRYGYVRGSIVGASHRLTAVATRVRGALARLYRVAYDTAAPTDPATSLSRVKSIELCDAANDCMAPVSFDFGSSANGFAAPAHGQMDTLNYAGTIPLVADVNGDGRADAVAVTLSPNGFYAHVSLASASGTYSGMQYNALSVGLNYSGSSVAVGDVNGDGRADLVALYAGSVFGATVALGNGDGTFQTAQNRVLSTGYDYTNYRPELADINNDGRSDVVAVSTTASGVHTMVALAAGGSYFHPVAYQWVTAVGFEGHEVALSDVNGDQMPDLVSMSPSASGFHIHTANSRGDGYFDGMQFQTLGVGTDFRASIPRLGDANGDGQPDLFVVSAGSGGLHSHVALGTGAGYMGPIRWNSLSGADFSGYEPLVADVNGDDVADLVLVARRSTGLWVQHVLGDGTGGFWPWTNAPSVGSANYLGYNVHVGDNTGDGMPDVILLQTSTGGFHSVSISNTSKVVRLERVTDSLGRDSYISYAPMTSGAIHQPDTGSDTCSYPCVDVVAPVALVSSVQTDDGVGGYRTSAYRYGGAKLDLHGRGWLGFRWMEVTDQTSGVRELTHYHQKWPLVGNSIASERFMDAGNSGRTMLSFAAKTWSSPPSFGGMVTFPHVVQQIARGYEFADGPSNTPVTETTTNTVFDSFGNPIAISATTVDPSHPGEVFQTDTYNSFHNDVGNWVLGRLVCAQVTTSAPGTPSLVRMSGFQYSPSNGQVVREVVEPASADIAEPVGMSDCTTGLALPSPNNVTLITDHQYDAFGNREVTTVSADGIESRSSTTQWGERSAGSPSVVLANGRFAVAVTNPLGHGEVSAQDAATGKTVWLRGPNAIETTWSLDGFARKVGEYRADGTSSHVLRTYCGLHGAVSCPLAPIGATSRIETGATGRPRSITFHDGLGREVRKASEAQDGRWVFIDTHYRSDGQVDRQSRPYFHGDVATHWTAFDYDGIARQTRITAPDGSQTWREYNGLSSTETDALGRRIVRTKNAAGQLVEVRQDNDSGAMPAQLVTLFARDAKGELLRTTDPGGNVTTLTYDHRGRKTAMADPDMGLWQYQYDAVGQLVSQTDARGQTTSNVYDRLGRLVQRTDDDGSGTETTTWTYDTAAHGIGKLHTAIGPGFGRIHEYDALTRPFRTTQTIAAEPFTSEVVYDASGRLALTRYPSTPKHPSGLEVHNIYGATGHLEQVTDGGSTIWWTANERNPDGQIVREALGNGLATTRTFNPATGRLRDIATGPASAPASVQNLQVEFDVLGNLVLRQDGVAQRRETFLYDGLNRLSVTTLLDTVTYQPVRADEVIAYDNLGNITSKTGVGNYTYGQAGAGPHAVTTAGSTSYTYDANGSMLTRGSDTIAWTVFAKPSVITGIGSTTTFLHGAERQRIQQTVTAGQSTRTTKYIGALYEKVTSTGAPDQHIHYVNAGGRKVIVTSYADATPTKTRYLHHDHLSSIVAVTDEAGSTVEQMAFGAWGLRRSAGTWLPPSIPIVAGETSRGFTDHEHLDDVALVHMNGRIYDPAIGRFMSADPHIQYPANSQSYNRYSYVLNNPLSYTDPSGFFLSKIFKAIAKPIKKLISSRIGRIALAAGAAWLSGGATTAWLTGGHWTISAAVDAGVEVGIGTIAAAGAASGFAGALVSTGSIKAAVKGAVFGGVSAGVARGIAQAAATNSALADLAAATHGLSTDALHGLAQGALSEAFGGDFVSGFSGAFAGHAAGRFSKNFLRGDGAHFVAARTLVASAAGGFAGLIAGGSPANSAISAAFSHLFNTEASERHTLERGQPALSDPAVRIALRRQLQRLADGCAKSFGTSCDVGFRLEKGPLSVDMARDLRNGHSALQKYGGGAIGGLAGAATTVLLLPLGPGGLAVTVVSAWVGTEVGALVSARLAAMPAEAGGLLFSTWSSYVPGGPHKRTVLVVHEWLLIHPHY